MLRAELWNWLAQKLPPIATKQISKEELLVCLPYLYANLEDRNSDVRKNAQEAVLGFMIHLSYEAMARNTEKLKVNSVYRLYHSRVDRFVFNLLIFS